MIEHKPWKGRKSLWIVSDQRLADKQDFSIEIVKFGFFLRKDFFDKKWSAKTSCRNIKPSKDYMGSE